MAKAADSPSTKQATPMQRARDPEIAVKEEYDDAMKKRTIEALEMFLQRHPDSPLAERARLEIVSLRNGQ